MYVCSVLDVCIWTYVCMLVTVVVCSVLAK